MRKPNFIQMLFIKHYLRTRKKLINRALSNNHYVVTELYSHKYMFAIQIEDVEEWIAELEHIGSIAIRILLLKKYLEANAGRNRYV